MALPLRAAPETQLDVDLLILDYLLYMGTRSLLQELVILHEEGIQENLSQQPMRMIDSFIPLFKCNHPTVRVPSGIKFRLRLVKFVALYSKRNTPCELTPPSAKLEELRRKHRKRAEDFYGSSSDSSFQNSLFELQKSSSSRHHPAVLSAGNQEESVSLADLVPMFISLSAARSTLFEDEPMSVHEGWMELAGEFMLQAALEQCLEYSDCSGSKLCEIFSWGWQPSPSKMWEDEEAVNDMFCDEDTLQETQHWSKIRQKYMDLLKPKANVDLAKQLKSLTRRYPLERFEERVLRFLEAMQLSQDPPLLAQLETGNVPGLSKRQVEELRQRIRLPS
ncbi:uncharacterized protein PV09_05845 [Verruconis gallopava]|uniref:Uncharacterized protein n=1 Tax=Verruconis gallopava TaxID=253628 RepID=A0A0D2A7P2_9PEZI|nr:uncharacterized protein PV09_05845 [Verruconis gallopava]KIW02783.1 hypothetical protein PV09_05845 [Verruconis gallopava]